MSEEEVDILIRLKELQSFVSGAKEAATAIKSIGTGAKESGVTSSGAFGKFETAVGRIKTAAKTAVTSLAGIGKSAVSQGGLASRAFLKIEETAKKPLFGGGVAGQLGALALSAVSIQGIKQAVTNTEELAKTASSFHTVTGMSTKDAATWSAVVQANGVNSRSFGLALKQVATQTSQFTAGNKTAQKEFSQLGISMNDVRKNGGNMSNMMNTVIDHFNKMPAGANKTAVATKLFGRNWQQLMPLLAGGSKSLEAERQAADKLGISFGGNATKNALKFHESQVMLKLAVTGLQVQFAQHLLPILMQLIPPLMSIAGVVLKSMNPAFKALGAIVNGVTGFLKSHHTILTAVKVIMVALIAQWVYGKAVILAARAAWALLTLAINLGKIALAAYKVVMVAITAATKMWTAIQWLLNTSLYGCPLIWIVAAIVALIAVIVLVVTHWKQVKQGAIDCWNAVKKAVNDAWNWMKNVANKIAQPFINAWNWIKTKADWLWNVVVKSFQIALQNLKTVGNKIAQPFITAFNTVKNAATTAWNFLQSIPGKIANAFSTLGSKIISPFQTAFNWVKAHVPKVSISMGSFHGIPYPKVSVSAQHGNVMRGTGLALVGEAGPEIVHLPHGAQITPIPRPSGATTVNPVSGPGRVEATSRTMPPFVVSVQINRKEIARAVGKYTSDQLARK